MGDVARMNAGGRYRAAVQQRLDDDTDADPEDVLWDVVAHLERVAIDSVEVDRVARELALDSDALDIPD